MSDRIAAAEAILATLNAARGRMTALAHAHLPFDRALFYEIQASQGVERARHQAMIELVDRQISLWRGTRAAFAAPPPQPLLPPARSLPVAAVPVTLVLDAEDVADEPTPVSGGDLIIPLMVPVEPEPEDTVSHVEATLASHAEPDASAELATQEHDELLAPEPIEETDPDIGMGEAESEEDLEAILLEEDHGDDGTWSDRLPAEGGDTEPIEPAPEEAEEDAEEDAESSQEGEVLELETPVAPDAAPEQQGEPAAAEDEEPPISFDHLVRFVDPTPRNTEILFEAENEDEVDEDATAQDGSAQDDADLSGQLIEDDDDLLDEAVAKALDDEPSVQTTLEEIGILPVDPTTAEPEEILEPDPPTMPGGEDPRGSGRRITVEDSGTEDLLDEDGRDEAPPIAPPVHRVPVTQVAAVGHADFDDERTMIGVPVLTESDLGDEPAPPPRRDGGRPATPVQIKPVGRGRPDASATLEISGGDHEEGTDDLRSSDSGTGFSVSLERPTVAEDDEEDSVYDLSANAASNAPRLTDDEDGYVVSPDDDDATPVQPEIDPALAAEFMQRARDAESRGDLARAIVHYQDLLDLTPESMHAYLGRGRCFMEMGDYAAAMSDFQRAEDLDSKSPEPMVEMGNLFFARKEYRRAIEFYDQAIDIDPTHAMARCRRGICHHYRKNHKQAFQDLQRAYSLNPEIPNIRKYVQMAVKAMEKGR